MKSQSTTEDLTQRFAAFLHQDYRQALSHNDVVSLQPEGTALFADISGFTSLTRLLSQDLGRNQGAQAVLAHINPVYEALITELYRYSGTVINFVGDAIVCWLNEQEGPSAIRAVAAALAMQQAMNQFTAVFLHHL
ncbi:MAG: hypothetical protein GY796_13855 [Chloroflexi bacterium]|nr:hypothetical protein [Chloroflexota bacterium]